ncbi:hypothetical protein OV079_24125 [Nannocystis pusilla]|uniref:Uncharacterized protein n=1 Tax=Nannocystis pusilla TaxID=889268 RepID=A0A9X3IXM0_9BACT|nr:hypothetical protein [Nannocystis pusilla]MCY1008592.1 hypothetical protein [Nannocystis pusilla]
MMSLNKNVCSLAFTLLIACGMEKNETSFVTSDDPSTDGSSGSEGESGSTTSAGASEPTSSAAPESSSGETPATSTTDEATSTTDATATGEAPPAGPCEAFCAHSIACEQDEPTSLEACLADCAADLAFFEGKCHTAWIAGLECKAGLTCEELAALNDGQPSACDAEVGQQAECAGGCGTGAGGQMDGSSCQWMQECPLEPTFEMTCDTETCQCFEDGVQVGECQAEAACLALATLADKAEACCGFPQVE